MGLGARASCQAVKEIYADGFRLSPCLHDGPFLLLSRSLSLSTQFLPLALSNLGAPLSLLVVQTRGGGRRRLADINMPSVDVMRSCLDSIHQISDGVSDSNLHLDAGCSEAFQFLGALPLLLQHGARAVCSLENMSALDIGLGSAKQHATGASLVIHFVHLPTDGWSALISGTEQRHNGFHLMFCLEGWKHVRGMDNPCVRSRHILLGCELLTRFVSKDPFSMTNKLL